MQLPHPATDHPEATLIPEFVAVSESSAGTHLYNCHRLKKCASVCVPVDLY